MRSWRVPCALLAVLLTGMPASAQFGNIFGDPPRPPQNVPRGRQPVPQPSPEPGSLQPLTPLPSTEEPFDEPPPLFPPQPAENRARPNTAIGVETQPLAPPPGSAAAPPPAPASPPAAAPPSAAAPPGGSPGSPAPAATAPAPDEVIVTEIPTQKVPNQTAVFSGLDKITGRITKFEVGLGETVQFGALQVRPRACYTRPPTEAPNTTGFIEVDEVTLKGEVQRLFRGWMFAASPGLHGVEHSIYDVWLSDCKGAASIAEIPAQVAPPANAAQPAPRPTTQPRPQTQRQPRPAQPPVQ